MSQYTASWPSGQHDSELVKYFEEFYKISDTPDAHEKYSEQFTKDATLHMISKKVEGRDAILSLRQGMWEKVASRSHHPLQVFPFSATEIMLHGTVSYVLKDGGKVNGVPWAARASMATEDGTLKMKYYQVYLDSASMAPK